LSWSIPGDGRSAQLAKLLIGQVLNACAQQRRLGSSFVALSGVAFSSMKRGSGFMECRAGI
jgi:hypothetical protein